MEIYTFFTSLTMRWSYKNYLFLGHITLQEQKVFKYKGKHEKTKWIVDNQQNLILFYKLFRYLKKKKIFLI